MPPHAAFSHCCPGTWGLPGKHTYIYIYIYIYMNNPPNPIIFGRAYMGARVIHGGQKTWARSNKLLPTKLVDSESCSLCSKAGPTRASSCY